MDFIKIQVRNYVKEVIILFLSVFFLIPTVGFAASVQFNDFTFEDDFTYGNKAFSADILYIPSEELPNGMYDLKAKVGIYGSVENITALESDILSGLTYKVKPVGSSQYIASLQIYSAMDHMIDNNQPGYVNSMLISSNSASASINPGKYQVDVLFNGSVITSLLNICLPTFTPAGGTPIGNQTCGTGSPSGQGGGSGGEGVPGNESPGGEEGQGGSSSPQDETLPNNTFIFGNGVTEGVLSTAVMNVPKVTWNDELAFRLKTTTNNIEIFGVNISDLQNGTATLSDFTINNSQNIEFNFLNNLSIANIINGNLPEGSGETPGVTINDMQFFYDFFYHIKAEVDLNGEDYSHVEVKFGHNPDNLTKVIAEFDNVSDTFSIDKIIYNKNNPGNNNEALVVPMSINRPYYIGIYGTQELPGEQWRKYPIAVKRLHTYVNKISDVGRLVVNWNPGPYMSVSSTGTVPANTVKFNLSGNIQAQNTTRGEVKLKFGYDPSTFRPALLYPAPLSAQADQNLVFQKQITNFYTDVTTFQVGRIEPSRMYYAGLYDDIGLIYFLQAGRTPDIINETGVTGNTETTTTNPEGGSLFGETADPFADLAQDLSSGIVPCDGVVEDCDYNQAINLIKRGMNFIFIMIIPIAAIAFSYAGYLLLFQGSKPESRTKARDVILKVFIGIAIVLAAWLIVKTILVSLGVTQTWALIDLGN